MAGTVKIAVIGGGWYGCYCAMRLQQEGFSVNLFEEKQELFRGVSGKDGIRLHAGPHYPRSAVTREECKTSHLRFTREFPELFLDHQEAIYCLGTSDCDGLISRIDWGTFKNVCKECEIFGSVTEIDCEKEGYTNVVGGFNVVEPSFYLDEPRHYFTEKLAQLGVNVILNHKVTDIKHISNGVVIDGQFYGIAVDCTYYKSFISKSPLPYHKEVVYQPSVGLMYAQNKEYTKAHHPFSFTVMDGWFPCIRPALFKHDNPYQEDRECYVLYHAKYSILGSFKTNKESESVLDAITDEWVLKKFKPKMEESVKTFYPRFDDEFEYIGWKKAGSCKILSKGEFRSSFVWAEGHVIHVLSGKVSTIFQAGDDVVAMVTEQQNNYKSGVDRAACELENDNLDQYRGSGSLQTRIELCLEEKA